MLKIGVCTCVVGISVLSSRYRYLWAIRTIIYSIHFKDGSCPLTAVLRLYSRYAWKRLTMHAWAIHINHHCGISSLAAVHPWPVRKPLTTLHQKLTDSWFSREYSIKLNMHTTKNTIIIVVILLQSCIIKYCRDCPIKSYRLY